MRSWMSRGRLRSCEHHHQCHGIGNDTNLPRVPQARFSGAVRCPRAQFCECLRLSRRNSTDVLVPLAVPQNFKNLVLSDRFTKALARCSIEPREKQNRTLRWTSVSLEPFSTWRLCLRLYAHRQRRLTASAVSDRASLESACHALAIGYSLRRHRLAPLAVTGSFGCEGAAITAGEKKWR